MYIQKNQLLVALYIFGVLTAQLMGAKTVTLLQHGDFRLSASVAVLVIPLLFTATDILVEVHGKRVARSMVYCGFIVTLLVIGFSMIATSLPPSVHSAPSETAYDTVFHSTVRIAAASLVAFAASELLDVAVFAALRRRLNSRALWLRNNVSNFVSQFVDSLVFLSLAFYTLHESLGSNAVFILGLLIPYWLLRCGLSVAETPLVYLGVSWLKKEEGVA